MNKICWIKSPQASGCGLTSFDDRKGSAEMNDPISQEENRTEAAAPLSAEDEQPTGPRLSEAEEEAVETAPEEKKSTFWRELASWLAWLLIPMAIVLLLNTYVFKLVRVSGESMFPTLHDRDILIVWQLGEIKQGDIVVFDNGSNNLVKRLIAKEGETVTIDYAANAVYVDGVRLDEPYVNGAEADLMEEKSDTVFTVPPGCVFVMGDNRNHSSDSRGAVGYVQEETVYGASILHIPLGSWLERAGW